MGEGKSASALSRDLKSYLKEPERLYRRVRDKYGNLGLSKRAKDYHPGQGVYRSSYKNAVRLTRTENNIAYHEANYLKYQEFDFVIGIEIRLSNNPNHCPFCASMAGKYPKDFKFWGWHPQCRCTTVPILKSWEEIQADNKRILEGKEPLKSADEVVSLPNALSNWIKDNKHKVDTARALPYWMQENKGYIGNGLKERYRDISFKTLYEGKNGGKVEVFTSGKQNKWEEKKNLNALKILADKGFTYRLLPVIEDGQKNPDAFNLATKMYADIKVTESTNGKNIVQSAMKEASKQNVGELILHIAKEPDSYRQMYYAFRYGVEQNRNKSVEKVILILANKEVRRYNVKRIKDYIKRQLKPNK